MSTGSPPQDGLEVATGRAVCMRCRLTLDGGIALPEPAEPQWHVQGQGPLPEKLQRALLGKRAGDRVEVELAPGDTFGERSGSRVVQLPRSQLRAAEPLELGMPVEGEAPGLPAARGRVIALTGETATVDFNHPFAGLKLYASVRIVAVATALPR